MKKNKSKIRNKKKNRNSKKGKKKDLTGESFEKRARRAIQYLNPDKIAKHDVKLESVYGGQRQFDVSLESISDQVAPDFLYEVKDYGANVPFEKVEAFETKLKELKRPPIMGGGMISAKGFQRGPLKRAKFFGDKSNIKKYYQLKAVESNDWGGLINQFTLAGTVNYPCVYDVTIIQEGERSGEVFKKSIDRQGTFLCNKDGEIVSNLLDQINLDLKNNILPSDKDDMVREVLFEKDLFLHFEEGIIQLKGYRYKVKFESLKSDYSIDFKGMVSDLLKDCLSGEKWFIPDEDKSLNVRKTGKLTEFTFEEKDRASIEELLNEDKKIEKIDEFDISSISNLMKTVFMRLLISTGKTGAESKFSNKEVDAYNLEVKDAIKLHMDGELELAKEKYWNILGKATCLEVLINLASIYQESEINQSKYLCNRACELFPDQVDGFVSLIEVFLLNNEIDRAREVLKAAELLHAFDLKYLSAKGKILLNEKNYPEALRVLSDIDFRNPTDAFNRMRMAFCLKEMGRLKEAAWDAMKAQSLDKLNESLAIISIKYCFKAKDYSDGVKIGVEYILNPKISTDSITEELVFNVVKCVENSGEWDILEKALAKIKNNKSILNYYAYLGACQFHLNDLNKASESYKKFLKSHPGNYTGCMNLAKILTNLGQQPKAIECLEKIEPKLRDRDYWEAKAICFSYLLNLDKIFSSIEGYRLSGGVPEELCHKCETLLFQLDEPILAGAICQKSLEFNGTSPEAIIRRLLVKLPEVWGTKEDPKEPLGELEHNRSDLEYSPLYAYVRCWELVLKEETESLTSFIESNLILTDVQAKMLASACLEMNWPKLAFKFVSIGESGIRLKRQEKIVFPEFSAIKFLAAIQTEDNLSNIEKIGRSLLPPSHPLDYLAKIYYEFLIGDLSKSLSSIDELVNKTKSEFRELLILKWHIKIELGLHGDLAKEIFTDEGEVQKIMNWWSSKGNIGTIPLGPLLVSHSEMGAKMHDADYYALLWDGINLGRVTTASKDWLQTFKFLYKLAKPGQVPVIFRARPPLKTCKTYRKVR